ncbi:MAG: porin [candidate division KSB1 bacterium]|nr:porin [candidate division KSB1 bacterium]
MSNTVFAQEEPLARQIQSITQHEAFKVNALLQAGFRYSLANDEFQGGRTFKAANARLSFRGMLDGKFYYRVFFNMVSEPNLLDVFIGYRHSDALRITTGAMKPRQTQDYIPDPGSTDFIDRTRITGLLVQSREIGISAEGDVNGLYYYSGLFNGNKMLSNSNNKFYGIGRLQYTFRNIIPGTLQLAVQGSHGDSPDVRSGSFGPMLRGERTIYGGDMRLETDHFLLAAEYLAGQLKTEDIADKKEEISGYYATAGYKLFKETMFLGRWQSWGYKEMNYRDNQFTFGINQNFTSITSFQLNFDSYFPENGDKQHGLSVCLLFCRYNFKSSP